MANRKAFPKLRRTVDGSYYLTLDDSVRMVLTKNHELIYFYHYADPVWE